MNEPPLILSLDTATIGGSICLSRGATVLASLVGDATTSHSNTLLSEIDQLLATSGISIEQIELFAVASGPGSFTGLRIGLASVKAFSATLKRPCVGIPTLQAVAHSAGPSPATVAVLPAGRGEVFAQLFGVSQSGAVTELDQAAHLPPAVMLAKYGARHNLAWAGVGAQTYREAIKEYAAGTGIEFSDSAQSTSGWTCVTRQDENLAVDIAALAWQRFHSGQLVSAESLQANYVRPSDAELKKNVTE